MEEQIKDLLWFNSQFLYALAFCIAELILKPPHHPVAAIYHNLRIVGAGHSSRKRRQRWNDFQIRGLDCREGRGCPVAQAADVRLQTARTKHFAGFVGSSGDER